MARRSAGGNGTVGARSEITTSVSASSAALGLGATPWAVYGVIIRAEVAASPSRSSARSRPTSANPPPPTRSPSSRPPRARPSESPPSSPQRPPRGSPCSWTRPRSPRSPRLLPPVYLVTSSPCPRVTLDLASLARADDATILAASLDASAKADAAGADQPWIGVVPDLDRETISLAEKFGAAAVLVQPGADSAPIALDGDQGANAAALVKLGPRGGSGRGARSRSQRGPRRRQAPTAVRAARVVAESALAAMANPQGDPIVISPGTSWMLDSDHRSRALEALAECPWNRLVTLSSILDGEPTAVAAVPESVADDADIPRESGDRGREPHPRPRLPRRSHLNPDPDLWAPGGLAALLPVLRGPLRHRRTGRPRHAIARVRRRDPGAGFSCRWEARSTSSRPREASPSPSATASMPRSPWSWCSRPAPTT